ncbi:hypothetical protein P8C59_006180 [Phyllachora maydis]|uniref:Phosphatidylinositol N-acetylglucosaminyltransferase subunit H conserved domain-containing protein n=1 Tax=Phyllachora maydis TaxID=1825666 RepID=A0AAD9I742_9PEZI|nr:hypothetical protein P8C59_006180 [Phyllachora maydis]
MLLTTAPYLHVRRPSATTAEFIVTTCPPATIPLRLALLGVLLFRAAAVFASLMLAYASLAVSPLHLDISPGPSPSEGGGLGEAGPGGATEDGGHAHPGHAVRSVLAYLVQDSAAAGWARAAVAGRAAWCPWWTVLAAAVLVLYYAAAAFQLHRTESLLVLRGLGIQTASSRGSSWSWGGGWGCGGVGRTTRFIPTEKIRAVLINEAFCGFQVIYYLIVVVEGEEEVVVVFPKLLPPRTVVESVWRGVRRCLYEPDGNDGR